jgi:hypothetical protein
VGGLALLAHGDGRRVVCNVEYNQLEPLLLATGHAAGDVNEARGGERARGLQLTIS